MYNLRCLIVSRLTWQMDNSPEARQWELYREAIGQVDEL
jgi:hypothetical protein